MEDEISNEPLTAFAIGKQIGKHHETVLQSVYRLRLVAERTRGRARYYNQNTIPAIIEDIKAHSRAPKKCR